MNPPLGPGSPFEVLLESSVDRETADGLSLPSEFQQVYGGDWRLPLPQTGCYRYSCFVISHDGKVSFNVPGHEGGGDVSAFNAHDQWIMGLLRARADAVVVGANTLRTEASHKWTSEFIFPADADAFSTLRANEQRRTSPLQVFITRAGDVPDSAAVYEDPALHVVFATSSRGSERIRATFSGEVPGDILVAGETDVDISEVFRALTQRYGVKSALCEGGPRIYSSLLTARQIDDEFLTLSPVIVGGSHTSYRPGLFDGEPFVPGNPIRRRVDSLRRAEDHLFMRAQYTWLE